MNGIFRSFPIAFKMIFTDPVNLMLSVVPSIIALGIYTFMITFVYRNSDQLVTFFRGYIYSPDQATILARFFTAILIIFIFFLMSWTFVVVVGVIAAPFNSLLSSRIETKLVQKIYMDENHKEAMAIVKSSMGQTFKNEFKKIIFVLFVACLAFLLNLFPIFYPVGLFFIAILIAVQFLDYSWSRHNIPFGKCFKDVVINVVPYTIAGFLFLLLITIPIVNAFVPALATSYFTVYWLHRQKKYVLT